MKKVLFVFALMSVVLISFSCSSKKEKQTPVRNEHLTKVKNPALFKLIRPNMKLIKKADGTNSFGLPKAKKGKIYTPPKKMEQKNEKKPVKSVKKMKIIKSVKPIKLIKPVKKDNKK